MTLRQQIIKAARMLGADVGEDAMIVPMEHGWRVSSVFVRKSMLTARKEK